MKFLVIICLFSLLFSCKDKDKPNSVKLDCRRYYFKSSYYSQLYDDSTASLEVIKNFEVYNSCKTRNLIGHIYLCNAYYNQVDTILLFEQDMKVPIEKSKNGEEWIKVRFDKGNIDYNLDLVTSNADSLILRRFRFFKGKITTILVEL